MQGPTEMIFFVCLSGSDKLLHWKWNWQIKIPNLTDSHIIPPFWSTIKIIISFSKVKLLETAQNKVILIGGEQH